MHLLNTNIKSHTRLHHYSFINLFLCSFLFYFFQKKEPLDCNNSVNTNLTIRVPSKESGSIGRPRKTSAVRNGGRSSHLIVVSRSKSIHDNLGLKIPDLDFLIGSSTQPVSVGREAKRVDDFTCIEGVKTLSFVKVPKHSSSVLSSRCTKRSIGRYTYSVKVSSVSNEVIAELAVGQGPNLYKTIPSSRDDEGNSNRGREANAGNPFAVSLSICGSVNGVLALSKSVPKLDGLITRSRYNLTVVYGKGNRKNILGVSNEATGGLSGVDFPKTEGSVPGSRKTKLSIGRDDNIGNEVVVSTEGTTGVSVCVFLSIVRGYRGSGEAPYHDGLVTGGGKKKGGILRSSSKGSDPVVVTSKGSTKRKRLRHVVNFYRLFVFSKDVFVFVKREKVGLSRSNTQHKKLRDGAWTQMKSILARNVSSKRGKLPTRTLTMLFFFVAAFETTRLYNIPFFLCSSHLTQNPTGPHLRIADTFLFI
jgi:hypothetical protein